jgi:hypothetical protein
MITLEDLLSAKEENKKIIEQLEVENRVFDKLIAIEEQKQDCNASEVTDENQVNELTNEQTI